ncbi:peptidoglycan-recognition protein SC2 [Eurosta solidaginis]|uniref:peptidoglycan-recognition protein SC2 n=1 Tax=Eurosta solidaginis TaxID=178769 RepID=UPI0035312E41
MIYIMQSQILTVFLYLNVVQALNITSRSQWGARTPTHKTALANGLPYVIIHHTTGSYCDTQADCIKQMKSIQNYHMDSLGWDDIGYNFLIGGDDHVYEGRGWNNMGAHAAKWNEKSIGISFIGNYNNDKPTSAQISATKDLIAQAVFRGQIDPNYILYGHRQVSSTECPGHNLYAEIMKWPNWKA